VVTGFPLENATTQNDYRGSMPSRTERKRA
jgi:hypothetical protein